MDLRKTSEEDLRILNEVERQVMEGLDVGFDPQVLQILDNIDANEREIEVLKNRIGAEVLSRLFSIANSVHYGHLRKGKVDNFYQVVSRLGMSFTKTLVIILALFSLVRNRQAEIVFARSFAVSVLAGKILAREFGLREDDAKRVELGGLFCEIGKIILILCREKHPQQWEEWKITDEFFERCHPYFGVKMIEKFSLPDYLREMVCSEHMIMGKDMLSLPGIVRLAWSAVDSSFRKSGKFLIESPMPDLEGVVVSTQGSMILDQFRAIGLEKYLEIVRRPVPEQQSKSRKEG